jgi:hypothetical protein
MNERIRQLVKQAEQYALDKANESEEEDFEISFDDDFQEKFAELIVQECMEVTKNYTCTSTWDYSAPVALARHFEIGPNYIVYPEIGVAE